LLFVTWRKGSHKEFEENSLRGCKGTTGNPQPLSSLLKKFALNAAFEDSRFDPIDTKEFTRLWCGVSLLHSFEECVDHFDWEVGIHGVRYTYVIVNFQCRRSDAVGRRFPSIFKFWKDLAPL
jgi:AMME syndrome candidate gene 1 protein